MSVAWNREEANGGRSSSDAFEKRPSADCHGVISPEKMFCSFRMKKSVIQMMRSNHNFDVF
jgi:hypothetical protein